MTVIPGVQTVHDRAEWEEDGYRMATSFTRQPPALQLPAVDLEAVHYTAAIDIPDGDLGEFDYQIGPFLAAIQRDYYNNRRAGSGYTRISDGKHFPGYAFGYSFAFDWLGGVWVGRGFDFSPAATSGHNSHTLAFLMLTDRYDPGTPLMWQSMRATAREANRRGARIANRPWGHGEFFTNTGTGTPTACPGDENLATIHEGLLDLDYDAQEETMHTVNERAYDSRGNQDDWGPELRVANAAVPLGPMSAGERRKVVVGMTNRAEVHITVLGEGPGYLAINGIDSRPKTSMVNAQPSGVDSGTWTLSTPEGAIYVWASHEGLDFIVDVVERQ